MIVKNKISDICIAFTILTVGTSILGFGSISHLHLILRFVVTAIGIGSMYIFEWLDHWPLRFVEVLHYVLSLGVAMGFMWLTGIFIDPISEGAYFEFFWNYTIIYALASFIYERKLRTEINEQNEILQKMKSN